MTKKADNPFKMDIWGAGMLNKLKGVARKRRKRIANKIRRRNNKHLIKEDNN